MELLNYLSKNIQDTINIPIILSKMNQLEEIRIRVNKNLILRFNQDELLTNYIVTVKDILETLEKITENSIYTYEKQISQGFITLPGGHRVGIVGNAIAEKNEIINISFISGMNFRIARQVKNCGNFILEKIYNRGIFQNTLIVGSPGSGKTTLLRDLIRQISNGNKFSKGLNVGVVDERNEIAAMYKGQEQTDLGIRTDVMAGIQKNIGIKLLIRSMAPDVIAVDEIGGRLDCESIYYAMCSGTKVLLTCHGNSFEDVKKNLELNQLLNNYTIERVIVLDSNIKEKAKQIYFLDKEKENYLKNAYNY